MTQRCARGGGGEETRSLDLHTHSTASDGTLSPTELVNHAWRSGVPGIALTDHDTLAGIAAARKRSAELGLQFLAGVELSTARPSLPDIHLLGYCIDGPSNLPLLQACDAMRESRGERAARIVRLLGNAGAAVPWDWVAEEAGEAPVGRPHIARALIRAGHAVDIKDAFRRWLAPGAPGYSPKSPIDTLEAVRLVRSVGGVPVLAHPGVLKLSEQELGRLLRELVDAGLAGLECYWQRHDPATVRICERLADSLKLARTGGSDFHGENKPSIEIGRLAEGRILGGATLSVIEMLGVHGPTGAADRGPEPRTAPAALPAPTGDLR